MLAALAFLSAAAWGGVAAGASRDSNLSQSSGDTPPVDAAAVTASAHAGGGLDAGESDEIFAEAGYDGMLYPSYPDLDGSRPSLTVGWHHWFAPWLRLRVAPFAGLRLMRENARDGWDAGVNASLRLRIHRRLRVTLGGGYTHRAADDPAFAWNSAQARAGVSLEIWRGGTLGVDYTFDAGDATFYAAPVVPGAAGNAMRASDPGQQQGPRQGGSGPGGRYGRPVTTFGTELIAYRAGRVAHSAGASVSQDLPGGFFVEAGWTFTVVRGDVQSYEASLGSFEVGFLY